MDPSIEPMQPPTSTSTPLDGPIAMTYSSRRRAKAPVPKGISLGLEEEVEFGLDEDLMENVGEIQVPVTQDWYPGKPDSPPRKTKVKSKESVLRTGLLGRRDKSKGLGDARLVISPSPAPPVSNHQRRNSDASYSGSSARTGVTSTTGTTGMTSLSSVSRLEGYQKEKEKEKNRSKVFKFFGKKKDEESVGSRSIASDSVESFGMGSVFSETCKSTLVLL